MKRRVIRKNITAYTNKLFISAMRREKCLKKELSRRLAIVDSRLILLVV